MKAPKAMKAMKAMKAKKAEENTKNFPARMYSTTQGLLSKPTKRNDRGQSFQELAEGLHEEWIQLRDDTSSYKLKNKKTGKYFV